MRTLGDVLRGGSGLKPRPIGTVDMSGAVNGIHLASPANTKNQRIAACENNFFRFERTYFGRHFEKPFCELHEYIRDRLESPGGDKRDALIAPRKFGKTTHINLAYPLWCLAYRKKRFILLIGESAGAAEGNLASITQEVETNEQLQEDFPHLKPAMDRRGQFVKWTDRQLVFSDHSTIMAKGMGSRMRGIKYRDMRPDLAIIDDPESPETADTFLKRRRHKRWFGGTFLGLGADGWDVFVIGNLPHHDSLIADLVKDPKWHGRMYRAINIPRRENERYPIGNSKEDGTALWPEVWPLDALEAYKKEPNVGSLGFAREMMNDPREEEDKPFNPLAFAYFDYTPDHRNQFQVTAMAIDPAGGEKPHEFKKGIRDWCAIVCGGRTKEGYIDIFDVALTKSVPDVQIEMALTLYAKHKVQSIGVEEVMFKNLYAPSMNRVAREMKLYPAVKTLKQPKLNKVSRILGIQPLTESGTIRFARHLVEKVPEFFAMFDEFPTSHDDGPDATEMLKSLLEKKKVKNMPQGVGGSSYWRRAS